MMKIRNVLCEKLLAGMPVGIKRNAFLTTMMLPAFVAVLSVGAAEETPAAAPVASPGAKGEVTHTASGWAKKFQEGGSTAKVQLALSIFGAVFVFERCFRLRRKLIAPRGVTERARELWKAGKFAELEALGVQEPSTLTRVISFIVKHRDSPLSDVSMMAGDIVSRELAVHHHRAYPMAVIATLEPLLGLLGMILGMISTFETVALAGALGDPSQLAGGISEALVTTGLGLAVAIPFLALYHVFKSKTNSFSVMLEEELTDLLADWLLRKEAPRAS